MKKFISDKSDYEKTMSRNYILFIMASVIITLLLPVGEIINSERTGADDIVVTQEMTKEKEIISEEIKSSTTNNTSVSGAITDNGLVNLEKGSVTDTKSVNEANQALNTDSGNINATSEALMTGENLSQITESANIDTPILIPNVTAAGVTTSISPRQASAFKYEWDIQGIEGQPYLVCVNRAACTVTVYGKDLAGNYTVPVRAMRCSVGRKGHGTPTGRYKTGTNRYEWRLMLDGTYARCAIGIYKGIMFHSVGYYSVNISDLEYEEFNKLGSPASLGCIRLCYADAYWLFTTLPVGFTTVIYDNELVPGPLGKPVTPLIDVENEYLRGYDPTELLMHTAAAK